MDCITISTYRNLEQQAIRQYKEIKKRDNNRQYSMETFRHENAEIMKAHRVNNEQSLISNIGKKVLNYFA